ncbi:MAG: conjugal transfer protein TraX [Clostridiales bacterium]|nr:conjugal transfer protein TraX [Clostridiales bacterium]
MNDLMLAARQREDSLRRFQCLDGLALKLIALVCMTIDHTAAILGCGGLYWPMRYIGRIAFPIYCFLIVEGYFHTRSKGKYLIRLLVFFLISEIPFDLAFHYAWYYPYYQNVMLTLAIGLVTVWAADRCPRWLEERAGRSLPRWGTWLLVAVIAIAGYCAGELLMTDYSGGGVLLILAFYLLREYPICLTAAVAFLLYWCFGTVELPGLLALIPIFLYNGKPGKRLPGPVGRYGFYAYYPLHIAVLVAIRFAMYGY